MRPNESTTDRSIRGILAVVLAGIAAFTGLSTVWQVVLYVVAAILAVTAVVGFCPLYKLVNFSSKK